MQKRHLTFAAALIFLTVIFSGCNDSPSGPVSLKDGDTVSFTLLQTTDVHHRVTGTGPSAEYGTASDTSNGGYSRIAAKVKEIQNQKEASSIPTLLVDSGDFLMGTIFDLSLGDVAIAFEFMKQLGYDAITFGNHEFDYGPSALASFLYAAQGDDGSGFNIPIIASNLVTDPSDPDDDGIEALQSSGMIQDIRVITLSNQLKVGIIGLLGQGAESDVPQASPVTFKNNFADPDDVAYIQEKVDTLRNDYGAHIIIALSHSGITDTQTSPEGDDITLADAISGIDIIASGHEHEMTQSIITENGTRIFCAGRYGENLAQLDITVTIGTGVTEAILENHTIDSTIAMDEDTELLVAAYKDAINVDLTQNGLPAMDDIIAFTDSDNLGKPGPSEESGMGNLVADGLRYMLGGVTQAVGAVPNGVIRDGFKQGQAISFADLYAVLPLGMTLDPAQQNIPGYPLMVIYLTGQEIKNMCQFIAYTIAADDSGFISSLPLLEAGYSSASDDASELANALNSGSPTDMGAYLTYVLPSAGTSPADEAIAAFDAAGTNDSTACQAAALVYEAAAELASDAAALSSGLSLVLPMLNSEYYMNTSGVKFSHAGASGLYQVQDAKIFQSNDFFCAGETSDIDLSALYPMVIDLYALLIMEDASVSTMLSALGIPIVPKDMSGTAIEDATLLNSRMDMDYDSSNGIQEIKEWMSFLFYLTGGEFAGGLISDTDYGYEELDRVTDLN